MDSQPKFKAQQVNPLFADQRAMRPPVPGAVAHLSREGDTAWQQGKVDGTLVETIPMLVAQELMKRGQQRYTVFCAPCHGLGGYGNGLISLRADELGEGTWVPPLSFHQEAVRQRPAGYLFDVISNGIRNMQPYGAQIPVADRWAIVAYLRALQRSQNARLEDVPADIRDNMRK
jgi:mono/diheme cytochrome c family protein